MTLSELKNSEPLKKSFWVFHRLSSLVAYNQVGISVSFLWDFEKQMLYLPMIKSSLLSAVALHKNLMVQCRLKLNYSVLLLLKNSKATYSRAVGLKV